MLVGHGSVLANTQHQGDWLDPMPEGLVADLEAKAAELFGSNDKGVPNGKLQAHVGYLSGLPGL